MKVVGNEVTVFRVRVKAVRYISTPRASFPDVSKFKIHPRTSAEVEVRLVNHGADFSHFENKTKYSIIELKNCWSNRI